MRTGRQRLALAVIALVVVPRLALTQPAEQTAVAPSTKLVAPAHGKIPVAFVVGRKGAETIDFVGPMEVFTFAANASRGTSMDDMQLFQMYTVSDTIMPIRCTGGLQIVPDYTFANAPEPKVVVVPATSTSPQMLAWIRKMREHDDVVMSVCLGAYCLAEAGVLSGKQATTMNGAQADFQQKYPDVHFLPNRRWVQSDSVVFTSGATGAGIDLALHIVDLYWGHDVAHQTAAWMNYPGKDWEGDGTESVKRSSPSDTH